MKEDNNDDRRSYIRIALKNIIKCELFQIPQELDGKKEFVSRNISAGGLLFTSTQKYELGDLLRLEISALGWEKYITGFYKPDELSATKPLVALATVVRVEMLSSNKFDIGVTLSGIDESHQRALDKYIKAILKADTM